MSATTGIRIIGITLLTFVFCHLWGIPWGLVAGAGVAGIVLP